MPHFSTEESFAGPLAGKTVAVTGKFRNILREKLEDFLRRQGAKVASTLSKKTSFLVVGYLLDDGRSIEEGTKFKKARELSTPVYSESQLQDFMRQQLKDPDFYIGRKPSKPEQNNS